DPIPSLSALAPRFDAGRVVVVVRGVLELAGRTILDRKLDAALPLVGVPNAVVKAELHLLLDVAGEVVRRHPARVDVERRLAAVLVGVDELQLHGIPGRAIGGPDQAALTGGRDTS